MLTFASPVGGDSHSDLELQIQIKEGMLGHFRVQLSGDAAPLAPWVVEALETPPDRRSAQQLVLLDDQFRRETPLLHAQRAKLLASVKAIDDFQHIE